MNIKKRHLLYALVDLLHGACRGDFVLRLDDVHGLTADLVNLEQLVCLQDKYGDGQGHEKHGDNGVNLKNKQTT